jgi:hypothetical protein
MTACPRATPCRVLRCAALLGSPCAVERVIDP